MTQFEIFDIKDAMAHLLLKESFDDCFLEEAIITTMSKMQLSGRRNHEWYDESEEKFPDNLYWKEAKAYVFSYIKGKRTPYSFAITLKLSKKEAQRIFGQGHFLQNPEEQKVDLLLHFRFEKGRLCFVTGVSYFEFCLDRQIEFAWDAMAEQLLKGLKIGFEKII